MNIEDNSLTIPPITENNLQNIKSQFTQLNTQPQSITMVNVDDLCFSPSLTVFAHWAIYTQSHITQLVFTQDEKTKKPISVVCQSTSMFGIDFSKRNVFTIGTTRYNPYQILQIGNSDYQKVFWNCKQFVKYLLKIICDEGFASIETSSDKLRLLLFGTYDWPFQSKSHTKKTNNFFETKEYLELSPIDRQILSSIPSKQDNDVHSQCLIM
ncbi:hypothetical protein DLAC_01764 [Tieghemostelium lacteum]|uniref:Uncharacterized protein n=1 Tax=Tieghemostelium lacteum TaxID=361077 RepID=A0A152A696_TIELA|nr:hypothetical protein DLAC_01764 [Tieghemostelium lacteum]|eukprot:KYR01754.1 hypothetical protein DLAC_01764 [Tieghemostelium lacteum]